LQSLLQPKLKPLLQPKLVPLLKPIQFKTASKMPEGNALKIDIDTMALMRVASYKYFNKI
jgi:hypothetical protein